MRLIRPQRAPKPSACPNHSSAHRGEHRRARPPTASLGLSGHARSRVKGRADREHSRSAPRHKRRLHVRMAARPRAHLGEHGKQLLGRNRQVVAQRHVGSMTGVERGAPIGRCDALRTSVERAVCRLCGHAAFGLDERDACVRRRKLVGEHVADPGEARAAAAQKERHVGP